MISISEFASLISAFASITTLVLGLIGFINLNMKVEVVRHEANSMKDQLVKEVRIASLAKGKLDEQIRSGVSV